MDLAKLTLNESLVWIGIVRALSRLTSRTVKVIIARQQLPIHLHPQGEDGFSIQFPWVDLVDTLPNTDSTTEFVLVSDSSRLGLRLLEHFSCIHVRAQGPVGFLDPSLFWAVGSGQTPLDDLEAISRALSVSLNLDALVAQLRCSTPKVALLTSVFDGDRFLDDFLENSAGLQGYENCEHFLIRAASPGNEHEALVRFAESWPSAVYVNLVSDPGLYAVWNLAACLATAPYLSNANLDDRRSPEQLKVLVGRLEQDPTIDVASAALRVSKRAPITWNESAGLPVLFGDGIPETYGVKRLFKAVNGQPAARNIPHCMPVWRRSLHSKYGYFYEPQYGPSADWEFWLRVGVEGVRFAHESKPLGLYLKRVDSYWGANSEVSEFDQLVIAQYGVFAGSSVDVNRKLGDSWPIGLRLRELDDLATSGAWLAFVARLCACAEMVEGVEQGAGSVALIDAYAKQKLSFDSFVRWYQMRTSIRDYDWWSSVLACLIEVLHAHEWTDQGCHQTAPLRIYTALVDGYQLTADNSAFIALALLMPSSRTD